MDTLEIKGRIGTLRKESEEKKHERKLLATDYEKLQKIVKVSGVTALITLLVHSVILNPWSNNHEHIMLVSLGRFLTPFALLVFLISFVIFLIKGFDLFVNLDNKYAKMAAEKFKINPVAEDLRVLNDAITMLDVEIDKLENTLYDRGENLDGIVVNEVKSDIGTKTLSGEKARDISDILVKKKSFEVVPEDDLVFDIQEDDKFDNSTTIKKSDITIEASERVERTIIERTIIERPTIDKLAAETKEEEKTVAENNFATENNVIDSFFKREEKKNSINDIFSGLDDFDLNDDDDEFESSSEMWEREAMKRFK